MNLIPTKNSNYNTKIQIKLLYFMLYIHNIFKNYFFLSTVIEWKNSDPTFSSVGSLSVSKENLVKFIRPCPNSVFHCHNCKKIKYLTWLCIGLSHLHEHIFKHTFQHCLCGFLSVRRDIYPHPQSHHRPLSCQAHLKSADCATPLFIGNHPLYIDFFCPPPPKNQIFQ